MSKGQQLNIVKTSTIPNPTYYVKAMTEDFRQWCFTEEEVPELKGKWRSEVFKVEESYPLDLEIGTGNGYHFAHHAEKYPKRRFVGIELKYKPLIQAIRRAVSRGCENAKILRYNARLLKDLFAPNELDTVFIHFPDPWSKKKQWKHRLIQDQFLDELYELQRPGSLLEFKTDNRDYFDWAFEKFKNSKYKILGYSYDLHHSEFADQNFVTGFEQIFLNKGLKINYILLKKS